MRMKKTISFFKPQTFTLSVEAQYVLIFRPFPLYDQIETSFQTKIHFNYIQDMIWSTHANLLLVLVLTAYVIQTQGILKDILIVYIDEINHKY